MGKIHFTYKGNINIVNTICEGLNKKYPLYDNFINQYFLKNKLEYFKDNSLDYCSIPEDCRSNSYLGGLYVILSLPFQFIIPTSTDNFPQYYLNISSQYYLNINSHS